MKLRRRTRNVNVQKEDGTYAGKKILENMEAALPRYTGHITDLIISAARLNILYQEKNAKILDFGAGLGTLAQSLREKLKTNVICVEVDQELVSKLIQRKFEVYTDLNISQQIDFIYTVNVLEHIEDDSEILKKMYSRLSDGGVLVIYVPANKLLFTQLDISVGHYRRYSKKDLVLKVKNAGFEVREVKYVDSIGGLASLVLKLLGRNMQKKTLTEKSFGFFDSWIFPSSLKADKLLFEKFFGKNLYLVATKKIKENPSSLQRY